MASFVASKDTRRVPYNAFAIPDIIENHGSGPYDGGVAHVEIRQDDGPHADVGEIAHSHIPGKMRARRDMNMVPDHAIVINGGSGIDDHILSNHGVHIYHG